MLSEFKSFYKTVGGNEGGKCQYRTRLDVYGCGCQHNCRYCYAKSLLSFRGLWDNKEPRVADISKIEKVIKRIPAGTVVRMGGMSDCFQPLEKTERVALETIKLLNRHRVSYLIVTKSHIVADREYLEAMDKNLAHIQITVTCLDDERTKRYESASPPSMRVKALTTLQDAGFDAALRISPLIEEYIDFPRFNALEVEKCQVEFLRVNSQIKKWFPGVDYSRYTVRQSNYWHLPLEEKLRVLAKLNLPNVSVCEDVSEHYAYWRRYVNPNKWDCCNLDRGVWPPAQAAALLPEDYEMEAAA
jgi:DNA repair photolyase